MGYKSFGVDASSHTRGCKKKVCSGISWSLHAWKMSSEKWKWSVFIYRASWYIQHQPSGHKWYLIYTRSVEHISVPKAELATGSNCRGGRRKGDSVWRSLFPLWFWSSDSQLTGWKGLVFQVCSKTEYSLIYTSHLKMNDKTCDKIKHHFQTSETINSVNHKFGAENNLWLIFPLIASRRRRSRAYW